MLRRRAREAIFRTREHAYRWARKAAVTTGARLNKTLRPFRARQPRCLGILLCYNDADFLPDVIEHMLEQKHELVVVDHGSSDNTARVLDSYGRHLLHREFVPRSFDFYKLYPRVSRLIMERWAAAFDWISWPDQDEILEGPTREKSYYEWVREVWESPDDWVVFNNMNFWQTSADDPRMLSAVRRVRHYSLFADCTPRIRAWRSRATNIRQFNHNPAEGQRVARHFNLRHYPMRTPSQMQRRIRVDRAGLQRGEFNFHYTHMARAGDILNIAPHQLHFDDGRGELSMDVKFDWRSVYGNGPQVSSRVS